MLHLINQYYNAIDITKNTNLEINTEFEVTAINAINKVYPFKMLP